MSSTRAQVRSAVTGEPRPAAAEWINSHGLGDGLVPDAALYDQQLVEAAVLNALARPTTLPPLTPAGTLYGVQGAEPSTDALTLRLAPDHAAAVLARLLPARTAESTFSGVAGLRPTVRNARIRLAFTTFGMEGMFVDVRANAVHRREAERLQAEAGLTPLWTMAQVTAAEKEAWKQTEGRLRDILRWSQALRRPGLFHETAHPNWSQSAPTDDEIAVPEKVLDPRSVAPREQVTAPVIAINAIDGGSGATTVALGVAAAMARSGVDTAALLGQDGVDRLLTDQAGKPMGQWTEIDQPGPGRLHVTARTESGLRALIRAAQQRGMAVVLDRAGWPGGREADTSSVKADVTLVLPSRRVSHNPYLWVDRVTVDRRPARVKMIDWLDQRYTDFLDSNPLSPLETLLQILEERFVIFLKDRAVDPDGEDIYSGLLNSEDEEDDFFADLLDDWWSPHSRDFPVRYDDLPPAMEADSLEQSRLHFLDLLKSEGLRRFGHDIWAQAERAWPDRSRTRACQGVHPSAMDPDAEASLHTHFLQQVAAEAAEHWGDLWPDQGRVWEEAKAQGSDLTEQWRDHIETYTEPRAPQDIARDLVDVTRAMTPTGAVILVSNAVIRFGEGSRPGQSEAVAPYLAQADIAGVVEIPYTFTVLERKGKALLSPQPALRAAYDTLANLVTSQVWRGVRTTLC